MVRHMLVCLQAHVRRIYMLVHCTYMRCVCMRCIYMLVCLQAHVRFRKTWLKVTPKKKKFW
jgi:hypothetical protein